MRRRSVSKTNPPRRLGRGLQTFQEPRKQVGSERGDDTDLDPIRTRVETFPDRLQDQRFVEDSERLLVRRASQRSEKDAAALALEQRRAETVRI